MRTAILPLLLSLVVTAAFAQAPPPPPPPPPSAPQRDAAMLARDTAKPREGTARLQGRVVRPEGEPIKRATVVLAGANSNEQSRSVTTDAEGRFVFERVPAGRLLLTARKVGYVTTGIGSTKPGGPPRPIDVTDGATLDNANITLAPGCAISGRLFDENGDPVSDASVSVLRYRFASGRRQLAPVGYSYQGTDDLGQFRIFGLAPGDYYVAAGIRATVINGEMAGGSSGYAPTYFPGTAAPTEATRITCSVGQDIAGIDFGLAAVPAVSVSGTVRDSSGKVPSSGLLMLLASGGAQGLPVGGATMIRSDGSFVFPEVVPGEYTLRAQVTGEGAMMALTVTRSVTGLALTTGRPGVARGRVVADAGVTAPLPTTQVSIVTAAWDTGFLGQGMPVRVKEDGTFEIAALHGLGMLRASAPGWYLKAVRHDGVDVTDTPLSFRYTADISGLEIVLSNRGTTFSGTVHSAKGAASRDYFLLVFPEDKAKWNWNSRFLQMARPDQSGRFRIEQLPPGDYLAVAVREAELDEWKDPEYLERIRAGATKVTLAEGEAKEVDLQLFTEEKR